MVSVGSTIKKIIRRALPTKSQTHAHSPTARRRVLFIVENLPVPFDRRVWQMATTLAENGYVISVICPMGKGYRKKYECIDGVHIYRHPLPFEANRAIAYLVEYTIALFWEFFLACKISLTRGFDVIHACNPPDTIFLIGGFFKLFGKKFLFDHHDVNPELFEAKFGKRNTYYHIVRSLEALTFRCADISIATNESYKKIAMKRGRMSPEKVFVVRSGPKLDRLRLLEPKSDLKCGKTFLVGYVGVMGKQEGVHFLLEAAAYIIHKLHRHDIHFGLVGGGTELEELKNYAKKLEIDEYITFTGRVCDDQLLNMLNTADVCVNPDVANEMNDISTMNKIMEYMALKKPIVQFDLLEGRFSSQEASLYALPNDPNDLALKILSLLDNPEQRKKMGEFGYKRVMTELEWRYEVPKLLAAYESLWQQF